MINKTSQAWTLSPDEIRSHQLGRLNVLLEQVSKRPFYRDRFAGVDLPLRSLDQISEIPLLKKSDLIPSSAGQPGRIFDLPPTDYARIHQTSGTGGFPVPVYDTAADWQWWLQCWDHVLEAAQISAADVAMMAFSFGPFIGFWTANDALLARGATILPGGGMTSEQRLRAIDNHRCTIVCCTPTYALHLANVAEANHINLRSNPVRTLIVAGEPGGSIGSVRNRIEQAWGATVIDHAGASELGAWGFGSSDGKGLHVIETEFIAELIRFDDQPPGAEPVAEGTVAEGTAAEGTAAEDGETAELVLTNLGRTGGAAVRYRTGDIVRGFREHDYPCRFLWLDGGVIGRSDDMIVVRGVNVFPSSIEAIVREQQPAAEFRIIATRQDEMDQLELEVEASPDSAQVLEELLRSRLAMRVPVRAVESNSLPRFEAKSRRLDDRRSLPKSQ